ncbi:MAG: Sfum_1244 family protein [Candidatus Thiodiazotropha sp.]
MSGTLRDLCCAVQHNCHISDARHGTDYGLCTYLLKMREYYRWENGLDYTAPLANESVGDWLTAREALWESLSEDSFAPLPLNDRFYDPFDSTAINQELEPLGLVYSAGYGAKNKPLFFLGHLERREQPQGLSIWVSGRELARDLSSPAAMCQGDEIYR